MKLLDSIIAKYIKILDWGIILCGIAMVVLTFLGAVVRKLGTSINWGDEIVRYLFIYATYLGSIIATYHGKHMMVDIVTGTAKGGFKLALEFLSDIVSLGFSAMMLYGGIKMLSVASVDFSPILHIPLPWIYFSLPLAGASMALIHFVQMVERIGRTIRKDKTGGQMV